MHNIVKPEGPFHLIVICIIMEMKVKMKIYEEGNAFFYTDPC